MMWHSSRRSRISTCLERSEAGQQSLYLGPRGNLRCLDTVVLQGVGDVLLGQILLVQLDDKLLVVLQRAVGHCDRTAAEVVAESVSRR